MYGLIGKGTVVVDDLYDIGKRVKEIDSEYFVFYRYASKRYEVHVRGQKGNTLAMVVPYEKLDARTLLLLRKTRIERMDEIEREHRSAELQLKKRQLKDATDKALSLYERTMSNNN